ncbi:MAG TPA: phosphate signaling complex protein PhoU [Candidatus Omnitrophota bacterium]|nr:phosphate signaling complex protein PhoU [Candidatus Omnitrophota bacterium]HPS37645.1 phosphate signaling complex protein PhoU [Candidatus Omnitrophota bacterium]
MDRHFAEELNTLKQKLFQMGLLVEGAIEKSFEALTERSEDRVKEVFENEKVINQLEIEIDEKGHTLLALVQPMAGDLRLITMILKINTDLERMGDHAVNIAEKSQYLIGQPPLKVDFPLADMAESTQKMVRDALDCFMNENIDLARKVLESDDKIDDYNDGLFADMVALMEKDPLSIRRALNVLMIGRNLERIADLSNNIAEDTIYLKQGKEVRHHFEST